MKGSFIILLILSVVLMSSIQAFTVMRHGRHGRRAPFKHGDIIAFKNKVHGSQRIIDANTADGAVYLRPTTKGFSGTHWRVHANRDGTYSFRNTGGQQKPQYKFLDGVTGSGKLKLSPNNRAPWTGTRWRVRTARDGSVTLQCMGHIKNNSHRFLDGHMSAHKLYLSPTTRGGYKGTHWKIITIRRAVNHRRVVIRRPIMRRRSVVLTRTLRPSFKHGDVIAFQNKVHGDQRWIDANTADGAVYLRPTTEGFSGTRWRVHKNCDGTYSFQCTGGQQKPQFRFLDGVTANGALKLSPNNAAPWTGTRWRVSRLSDGSHAFKCMGHIKNNDHQYLDAHMTEHRIYLSPKTSGMFTGTHWLIKKF